MFTKSISNDADKLLHAFFKEYLKRRKDKLSKDDAMSFECDKIRERLFPKWLPDDFTNAVCELSDANFLSLDIIGDFELTDAAIVHMENLPRNNASDIIDTVSKLDPLKFIR